MTLNLSTIEPASEDSLRTFGVWDQVTPGTDVVRTSDSYRFLSYDSCARLLRHTGFGVGFRQLFEGVGVNDEWLINRAETSVMGAEGTEHVRLRSAIGSFFTPQRTESFRSEVRTMIEDLIDRADTGEEFDVVDSVLRHIPARFFAILTGLPQDSSDTIGQMSAALTKVFTMDPSAHEDTTSSRYAATEWAESVVATSDRSDHLVGHLMRQQDEGVLSPQDVSNALTTLLAASSDTTQSLMTNIVGAFADNPEQWTLLRTDSDLVPGAVMEAARWAPASGWSFRVALDDVELDGLTIPRGTHAWAVVPAANRDPRVFERPDVLDIVRDRPRPPLNWSVGRHFCLGRVIAVMECEELIHAMSSRWSAINRASQVPSELHAGEAPTSLVIVGQSSS